MIEYTLSGQKNSEIILFVHGLGANLEQFAEQHRFFSSTYRVLSVNLPGHGNSKGNPSESALEAASLFTLEGMAEEVVKLLDYLEIPQVHFVGNSLGGNVGYELLKSAHHRLKSLCTFGTTGELKTSPFTVRMLKLTYQVLGSKAIAALSSLSGANKESREKIRSIFAAGNKKSIINILPGIANFSYLQTIRNTKTPVLIMRGEKDRDINAVLKSTLDTLEERGNFTLREVPGAGHFINLDNPQLFNTMLLDFIESQDQ